MSKKVFENREISWLRFNKRVLFQALDQKTPILERVKFLSIYGSNLDEFLSVRVGALLDRALLQADKEEDDAYQQILDVMNWLNENDKTVYRVFKALVKNLESINVRWVHRHNVTSDDKKTIKKIWITKIKPFLSPQIILANHPFPFLVNNKEYLMMTLVRDSDHKKVRYGIISTDNLPPFFHYEHNGVHHIVQSRDIIEEYANELYTKDEVAELVSVRVTRNAEIDVEVSLLDEDMDYRDFMEDLIEKRPLLGPVRLQLDRKVSEDFKEYIQSKLGCPDELVVINKYPLNLASGFELHSKLTSLIGHHIYEERTSIEPIDFSESRIMDSIRTRDVLIAYPYHSSRQFVQLLYEAANDPLVESINITLYRVARSSRVISALVYAAEKGKKVTAVIELRARFDEARNINYSKMLEEAGAKVIYGIPFYKVHGKVCVIKDSQDNYITYIGTGNFNEITQEQYTDLALITTEQAVGEDAVHLFECIEKHELVQETQTLWIAPHVFRQQIVEQIDEEISFGEHGQIVMKMNSFNDPLIMDKLVEASGAGVKIFLIVRGICSLIPHVPGITDNITVKSIVGRYLEHSRIYAFGGDSRSRIYIGSGDLLNRNTQRRIEVFAKIKQENLRVQVMKILQTELSEQSEGWLMQSDATYQKIEGDTKHSQDILFEYYKRKPVI